MRILSENLAHGSRFRFETERDRAGRRTGQVLALPGEDKRDMKQSMNQGQEFLLL